MILTAAAGMVSLIIRKKTGFKGWIPLLGLALLVLLPQLYLWKTQNRGFYELRIISGSYQMDDPSSRTAFHREIARKLCAFADDLERDNYITAAADKYMIRAESLRRLVAQYGNASGYGTEAQSGGNRNRSGNRIRTGGCAEIVVEQRHDAGVAAQDQRQQVNQQYNTLENMQYFSHGFKPLIRIRPSGIAKQRGIRRYTDN